MDAPNPHENITLFLQEKWCPWVQVPWAEGTCERQVGSPQPSLGPFTLVLAEAGRLLLSPISGHHGGWGWTTLS